MKTRFSLLAKILSWFFLNLSILGLAALAFLSVQYEMGTELLLSGQAGERIHAVGRLISSDLGNRQRSEWEETMTRFSAAYGVSFALFRGDGHQAAGTRMTLPAAVRERIRERPLPRREESRGDRRGNQPEDNFGSRPRPIERLRDAEAFPTPPFLVKVDNPRQFWIGQRIRITPPDAPRTSPVPLILFVVSDNIRAGGLLMDLQLWFWVAAGSIVFSILFWIPLVKGITRSIGQMQVATSEFAEGRFDSRVDEKRRDELGLLGASINKMAVRLSGFITGQKRFLGDIAHELCSPIARMQMAVGILEERAEPSQKSYVQDLREEVQEISTLVNELLSFSKASLGAENVRLQMVLIKPLLEKAVHRERQNEPVTIESGEAIQAWADPELIVRAVSNLVRNAVCHAAGAGTIHVSARSEGEFTLIRVRDEGKGVPAEDLDKLFDPFFRVDPSRTRTTGGVGLGLSIVKTCIESSGGSVSCHNLEPKGFEVVIWLKGSPEAAG